MLGKERHKMSRKSRIPYPANQSPLDISIQASKSIFVLLDQIALEDKNMLEREVLTETNKDLDGNNVTVMRPLQDVVENPVKQIAAVPEFPPLKCAQ